MYELGVFFVSLVLIGLAIGIAWRWHPAGLFILCFLLGFLLLYIFWDWSDISFFALLQDTEALFSSMIYFAMYLAFWAGPVIAGGAIGFALRQSYQKSHQREKEGNIAGN